MRAALALLGAVLLGAAGLVLAGPATHAAKCVVARSLIERALAAHLADGRAHPPWRGADTWPLAALTVPRFALRRVVLAGASGSSLAWDAGHVDGTAAPNAPGNCVLAGHRDGRFAFLRELRRGDLVVLQSAGALRRYRVADLRVAHETETGLLDPADGTRLTLVTCYPFGALGGGPWRFVVTCLPE